MKCYKISQNIALLSIFNYSAGKLKPAVIHLITTINLAGVNSRRIQTITKKSCHLKWKPDHVTYETCWKQKFSRFFCSIQSSYCFGLSLIENWSDDRSQFSTRSAFRWQSFGTQITKHTRFIGRNTDADIRVDSDCVRAMALCMPPNNCHLNVGGVRERGKRRRVGGGV